MRQRFTQRAARISICALALLTASFAEAHDPGLSSANVTVTGSGVRAVMTFNPRDLAQFERESLAKVAERAATLIVDRRTVSPRSSSANRNSDAAVEFVVVFDLPRDASDTIFRSLLLDQLPFGHRQAVTITDGSGREIARRLLSASDNSVAIPIGSLAAPPGPGSFVEFLLLGVRHILTGYDHLLFLFALLVMCRTARSAALLITCFTAAHSLTLCLATFGIVNLESRITESAIAASIVYVGIENLVRGERRIPARWLLTFAFGLIHGLGFASVLREMAIARNGAAAIVPLLGFNTGVEAGQLSVAAIVLPIVWSLRRQRWFVPAGVRACSIAVVAAGSYWLLMRSLF